MYVLEVSKDIHTHDSDCIDYIEINQYENLGNPYSYRTGYKAWCNILDKEIDKDDSDDSDYWEEEYD